MLPVLKIPRLDISNFSDYNHHYKCVETLCTIAFFTIFFAQALIFNGNALYAKIFSFSFILRLKLSAYFKIKWHICSMPLRIIWNNLQVVWYDFNKHCKSICTRCSYISSSVLFQKIRTRNSNFLRKTPQNTGACGGIFAGWYTDLSVNGSR